MGGLLRALNTVVQCNGYRLYKQHASTAVSTVHMHLLYPVCAHGQINQLAKKLLSLFAVPYSRKFWQFGEFFENR